jgi:hypothetical protein
MIAPIEIAAPKNHQDFELLCLRLWGEIWEIPHEIEFNSDNSQGQNGVDIFGIPKGEKQYYGIQCKNKKLHLIDGRKNRILTNDIEIEVNKALNFDQPLKKLIIATSLNVDREIQEFVRRKDIEHLSKNLFRIQICFWEFFQRKIIEFKSVNDWYLKNENYFLSKKLSVTIDGKTEKSFVPKFRKTIKKYILESVRDENRMKLEIFKDGVNISNSYPKRVWNFEKVQQYNYNHLSYNAKIDWEQRCWFQLQFLNTGTDVLEYFKIEIQFEGEFEEVGVQSTPIFELKTFKRNTFSYKNSNDCFVVNPLLNTLVQDDYFFSNKLYIKPLKNKCSEVTLKWKLIAKDFQDTGSLAIWMRPKYVLDEEFYYVSDPSNVKEMIEYSLIKRKGMINIGSTQFFDKESDFTFE